jgi:hypothetical protein
MMAELDRILENKPVRPPMISTLALRWQSMCPPGGALSASDPGALKQVDDEVSLADETKDKNVNFCSLQWRTSSLHGQPRASPHQPSAATHPHLYPQMPRSRSSSRGMSRSSSATSSLSGFATYRPSPSVRTPQ